MTTFSSPSGVDHIVLIKAKPTATEQQMETMLTGVHSLAAIPGVAWVTVGPTFCDSAQDRRDGVDYVIYVRLESKEALQLYQDHALHVQVRDEMIRPICAEPPKAMDWASPIVAK